jgi:hypothetical protein
VDITFLRNKIQPSAMTLSQKRGHQAGKHYPIEGPGAPDAGHAGGDPLDLSEMK